MFDLDELERLARAATPGSWKVSPLTPYVVAAANGDHLVVVTPSRSTDVPERLANIRYIAAINPATVLMLIGRLRDAERERDQAVLERDTLLRHGVPTAGRGW